MQAYKALEHIQSIISSNLIIGNIHAQPKYLEALIHTMDLDQPNFIALNSYWLPWENTDSLTPRYHARYKKC